MKNKEFKKGVAIGVAATLVVTGAGFVSYQKVLVSQRKCAVRYEDSPEAELPGRADR